jgi:uncharacterized protein involved in exopolysaccharide biosynthesis
VRSFLTSLFKDAPTTVAVGLLVFALAVLASELKRPTYTASASLLVLGSDDYASRPPTLSPQVVQSASLMTRDAMLSSEISILNSRPVIKATVDKIGVQRLYPALAKGETEGFLASSFGPSSQSPQEKAAARFASTIQVKGDRSGSTIQLSFPHNDPAVASDAVNAMVVAYQSRRQSIYSSAESQVVESTVRQAHEQLDKVSQELAEYQASNGISNYETQMDLLLRRMSDQTRTLQGAQTEAAELQKRIASLRQQLDSAPHSVVQYQDSDPDRRVQTMRDSLAELRRREAELLQTYTERSERVANIRGQIQTIEQQIASAAGGNAPTGVRRGLNEVRTAIELELMRASSQANAVNQRRQDLAQQAAAIESQIRDMQAKEGRLHELARQKTLAEQAFIDATKALQERRNMEDLGARRAANVRTIEAAEAPTKPDRTRLAIMLAGTFLALVAVAVTALLRHFLRATYIDGGPLHRDTGVPVLGVIMEWSTPMAALEQPRRSS